MGKNGENVASVSRNGRKIRQSRQRHWANFARIDYLSVTLHLVFSLIIKEQKFASCQLEYGLKVRECHIRPLL